MGDFQTTDIKKFFFHFQFHHCQSLQTEDKNSSQLFEPISVDKNIFLWGKIKGEETSKPDTNETSISTSANLQARLYMAHLHIVQQNTIPFPRNTVNNAFYSKIH